MIRRIQTTNISFRATGELKRNLEKFCEEMHVHYSSVIRQAVAAYLQREMTAQPHEPSGQELRT